MPVDVQAGVDCVPPALRCFPLLPRMWENRSRPGPSPHSAHVGTTYREAEQRLHPGWRAGSDGSIVSSSGGSGAQGELGFGAAVAGTAAILMGLLVVVLGAVVILMWSDG